MSLFDNVPCSDVTMKMAVKTMMSQLVPDINKDSIESIVFYILEMIGQIHERGLEKYYVWPVGAL